MSESAVINISTFINLLLFQGALVSVCADDSLHLWNFRQKRPDIVHTLKFQRERITYCHLPFQSKWLYVGTERGNVHMVNISTFSLSGYVINWNKAIELSRKTHPGPVVHLSDNPLDPNKLLIGFETGTIVLWDLKSKAAEYRFNSPEALRSLSWHHEGKQFMCSHTDGSLTTYNIKTPQKPVNIMMPHAKINKEGKPDPCKPISKVEWKSVRNGEPLVIFSGGISYDRAGTTPSITVMNGKSTTVLEMEHNVVDFVVLCETPYQNDFQEPYAIVVLLQNDLVVVDLTTPGYGKLGLTAAGRFYSYFVRIGQSREENGGHLHVAIQRLLLLVTLQVLYKLKTAKIFEKPKNRTGDNQDEDVFAVYQIVLNAESRIMCVAGATHLILFKFSKQELSVEVSGIDVSIVYEIYDELESPEIEYPRPSLSVVSQQQSGSKESYTSNASDHSSCRGDISTAVKVRSGSRKYAAGFYPYLVCSLNWFDNEPPGNITTMAVNSSYGLLAFGNESGLAIIDYVQKTVLISMGTPDLYGTMDPYQRVPRSPRSKKFPTTEGSGPEEGARSPTTEQCNQLSSSPPPSPKAKPRKKNSRSELQPLTAIHEGHTQELDENRNKEYGEIEQAVPAEELDRIVNNLDSDLYNEDFFRSELASLANNASVNVGRSVSVPSGPNEGLDAIQNLPTSPSDSKLHEKSNYRPKKTACKTVSDPSMLQVKFEENRVPIETVSRPRSSSDPDTEQLPDLDELPPVPKVRHRKFSVPNFHFNKNKKRKKPKERDKEKLHITSSNSDSEILEKSEDELEHPESDDLSDSEPHPPPRSFLRRMSCKVKNIVLGNDKDDKKFMVEVLDMTSDEGKLLHEKCTVDELQRAILPDRNDTSSFSRSRSSSMSSLENVSKEGVQSLVFSDSYTRKTDNYTCPCLWLGTSLGSVLVIVLNLPPPGEQRLSQPVIVSPSGTIFRLKGAILTMSFLDCNGVLIPTVSDQWRDTSTKDKEKQTHRQNTVVQRPKISPTSSTEWTGDKQYAIICSEKQARVISLPSQHCPYKTRITESSFVVRADVVTIRDSVCLACYVANGRIMTFSLPSLKPLLDIDFLPLTDLRIARTFCFSSNGHACYLPSPTEIQKITFSADISDNLNEMLGDLFLPCETPEAPKQGFFKNWFGSTPSQLDREELFGEASGKGPRGLATKYQGKGGMQNVQNQAGSVTGDIRRTRMLFDERGEKLGELGERTEQMMTNAQAFADSAHQIMMKNKNKKWYQF
ncbi:hypothetical protein FSP39_003169 [Pinctada imbricata]|uniref:Syntaxin-binding protein 5-like n=1 Tax=Pinctada imbricata TaxID=66713 RepID=A0AA88XPM1_PINIB|nr:hypothetical protein FSP39_003169 [Pinctada imbricata]